VLLVILDVMPMKPEDDVQILCLVVVGRNVNSRGRDAAPGIRTMTTLRGRLFDVQGRALQGGVGVVYCYRDVRTHEILLPAATRHRTAALPWRGTAFRRPATPPQASENLSCRDMRFPAPHRTTASSFSLSTRPKGNPRVGPSAAQARSDRWG